jgi:hypothetical protein
VLSGAVLGMLFGEEMGYQKVVGVGSVVKIVIEYSPSQERVIVRGVFFEDSPKVPLLDQENIQNHIKCFFDVPLSTKVGFAGLSVEEVDKNVE